MRYFLSYFLLCCALLSGEDPWGKDADLTYSCPHDPLPCQTLVLGAFGETMIAFHKNVISPADGPRSHYKPSSSQYTLDAMRKYGFFWGFLWGCDRLMRENNDPWIYETILDAEGDCFKWDPVR